MRFPRKLHSLISCSGDVKGGVEPVIKSQIYNTSFSGRIKAFSEIMTGATLFLQVVSYERCFDVEQLSEVTGLVLLLHFFPRVKD